MWFSAASVPQNPKLQTRKPIKRLITAFPLPLQNLPNKTESKHLLQSRPWAQMQIAVFFTTKTKGEMQRDVLKQNIENTYILQPSLIVGDRNENRLGEEVATFFMKTFGFLIPKKYKMIEAETIAEAMLVLANEGFSKQQINSDEIKQIAQNARNRT